MAPQGYLASGYAYTCKYEKGKMCWWHCSMGWRIVWSLMGMIDYLELIGKNGVLLNPEKLQFAQKQIDFAGFTITQSEINP